MVAGALDHREDRTRGDSGAPPLADNSLAGVTGLFPTLLDVLGLEVSVGSLGGVVAGAWDHRDGRTMGDKAVLGDDWMPDRRLLAAAADLDADLKGDGGVVNDPSS